MGVLLLECLKLLEVAENRPRPRHGFSRHRFVGGPRLLIVGPFVSELADHRARAVWRHVAEGVVDDGQTVCGAAGLHVLDRVIAAVDAPFDEVPDNSAASATSCRGGRRTGCCKRNGGERRQDCHRCDEASCRLQGPLRPAASSASGSYHLPDGTFSRGPLCVNNQAIFRA